MEIEGDCLKLRLKEGVKLEIGRGLGSDSTDRTVSRRHVCFQLLTSHNQNEIRARFEVIGMNPIWVQYSKTGEIKMYTSLETGEMESGDKFCVSAKKPIWLTLKRLELEAEIRELGLEIELDTSSQIEELDVDSIDISALDPVKEFGFVVMGHEFDCYPKIHNIKNWNWFIEEHGEESENDEVSGRKGNGGRRRKRKKKGGDKNDADEWTDENEEVKEVLAKSNKVNRPKYLTRSKGSDRPVKVAKRGRNSPQIDNEEDDEEEEEDEDDETLGGFIVDEDTAGEEPDNEEEDEEEEEFDEEDDEE